MLISSLHVIYVIVNVVLNSQSSESSAWNTYQSIYLGAFNSGILVTVTAALLHPLVSRVSPLKLDFTCAYDIAYVVCSVFLLCVVGPGILTHSIPMIAVYAFIPIVAALPIVLVHFVIRPFVGKKFNVPIWLLDFVELLILHFYVLTILQLALNYGVLFYSGNYKYLDVIKVEFNARKPVNSICGHRYSPYNAINFISYFV